MNVQMRVHILRTLITRSSTRSHPSEEENRTTQEIAAKIARVNGPLGLAVENLLNFAVCDIKTFKQCNQNNVYCSVEQCKLQTANSKSHLKQRSIIFQGG
jgi:hypothetical protein